MKLILHRRCCRLSVLDCLVLLSVLLISGCKPSPPPHGTVFILELDTNQLQQTASLTELSRQVQSKLDTRLSEVGVRPFFEIATNGHNFSVKVPELKPERLTAVREMITAHGLLEFRLVHTNSAELTQKGLIAPGYELLKLTRRQGSGEMFVQSLLVNRTPELGLTGKYLKRAAVVRQQVTGEPQISFELDAEGARLFETLTRQHQPSNGQYQQLAIVLDGQLVSAPRLMGVISGGRAMITGSFTVNQALGLCSILLNPVTVPYHLVEERGF